MMGDFFTKYGSDKNTFHTYGPVYDSLFPNADARARVTSVLEIGIASGQSLLAWRDIFPNAQIVGFDKEPCHRAEVGSEDARVFPLCPRPDRLEIHQGDVGNYDDLMRAVNGRKFDLIVEDSSHLLHHNLMALYWLFRHVKYGGFYVIEELDGTGFDISAMVELFPMMVPRFTPPPHGGEILYVFPR